MNCDHIKRPITQTCDNIKRLLLYVIYSLKTTTDPQMRMAKFRMEVIPPTTQTSPQIHPRTQRINDERSAAPATTRKCAPSFLHDSGLSF